MTTNCYRTKQKLKRKHRENDSFGTRKLRSTEIFSATQFVYVSLSRLLLNIYLFICLLLNHTRSTKQINPTK